MKFMHKAEHIRQYGVLPLTCHPKVMQALLEILDKVNHNNARPNAKSPSSDGPCHMFRSGSKLYWRDGKGGSDYHIYCYSSDASDGLAAIEELKMAYCLRDAERNFRKMKKLMGSDYPIDGKRSQLVFDTEWVYAANYHMI